VTSRDSGTGPANAARRNLVAGAIGSVLEWYDFAIYGYLAPIIGTLFFPADDPVASLLAAFGVFAIGFAARPVGGLIFGYIGDKHGRKPALTISVVAMGVATFAIGVMPTHARAGAAAAVALVLLRIVGYYANAFRNEPAISSSAALALSCNRVMRMKP
jgi:MHS family proline/betaine transporter-like MFS transporter